MDDIIRLIRKVERRYTLPIASVEDYMPTQVHNDPKLSRNEWLAVSIALQDAAVWDYAPPAKRGPIRSRIDAMFRALTGARPPRPLADPRLETLRAFVWATRRRRTPPRELIPALRENGFNPAQIEAVALLAA